MSYRDVEAATAMESFTRLVPDADALRGIGAPPGELAPCVAAVLARGGSVRSEILSTPAEHWSEIRRTRDALDARRGAIFDGFTDAEAQRCIARRRVGQTPDRVTGVDRERPQ